MMHAPKSRVEISRDISVSSVLCSLPVPLNKFLPLLRCAEHGLEFILLWSARVCVSRGLTVHVHRACSVCAVCGVCCLRVARGRALS